MYPGHRLFLWCIKFHVCLLFEKSPLLVYITISNLEEITTDNFNMKPSLVKSKDNFSLFFQYFLLGIIWYRLSIWLIYIHSIEYRCKYLHYSSKWKGIRWLSGQVIMLLAHQFSWPVYKLSLEKFHGFLKINWTIDLILYTMICKLFLG